MAKTHFFEAIPAKLRFKIFLSYHDLYKTRSKLLFFLITPFGAPFANCGAPFNWVPGQISSFAPPSGRP